jgi:SWI/SNF-related matrix-associated actin-dependent regulator of chromatin subfamily A3
MYSVTGIAGLTKASIMEVITRDARCPMDRRALRIGDLIEQPPPTELTQMPIRAEDEIDETTDIRAGSSSKIDQLLQLLRLTPENEKSLVFSQFTTFLDKVRSYITVDCPRANYLSKKDRRSSR